MKHKILSIVLLIASTSVFSYGQRFIINKITNSIQNVSAVFDNEGYSAVVIRTSNSKDNSINQVAYATARTRETIYTVSFSEETTPYYSVQVEGYSLKGRLDVEPERDYVYTLPFINNANRFVYTRDSTLYSKLPRAAVKHHIIAMTAQNQETVHACRRGQLICVHERKDEDGEKYYSLCIQHNDGTVMSYYMLKDLRKSLKKGDFVVPGEELGVIKPSADNSPLFCIELSCALLNPNINKRPVPYEQVIIPHSLVPKFTTSAGITELQNEQWYSPKISDELMTKEMTDSEKRKYNAKKQ